MDDVWKVVLRRKEKIGQKISERLLDVSRLYGACGTTENERCTV
jgi:hypothetical protein